MSRHQITGLHLATKSKTLCIITQKEIPVQLVSVKKGTISEEIMKTTKPLSLLTFIVLMYLTVAQRSKWYEHEPF